MSEFREILPGDGVRDGSFRTYCQIKAVDGAEIKIERDLGPHVWISIREDGFAAADSLTIEKAKIVRDALNEFLQEATNAEAKE